MADAIYTIGQGEGITGTRASATSERQRTPQTRRKGTETFRLALENRTQNHTGCGLWALRAKQSRIVADLRAHSQQLLALLWVVFLSLAGGDVDSPNEPRTKPGSITGMRWVQAISAGLFATFVAQPPVAARITAGQEQTSVGYRNAPAGVAYMGDETCRECHEPQYNDFKKTGMGRSLSIPGPGNWPEFTKSVTLLNKKLGRRYTVSVTGGKMYHTESGMRADGKQEYSEKHEVAFTVGSGDLGRSYLVAKGDALFVSPISYYKGIRGWGLSPGYESGQFLSFTRPVWNLCASCHAGLSRPILGTRNRYQVPAFRFLSVGCERCHGPGELHVRERRENRPLSGAVDFSIVNPARLPPHLRDDVCKQCHLLGDAQILRPGKTYLDFRPGTSLDNVVSIFSAPVTAKVEVIRALSHPEQLEMSRCSIQSNRRLGCITCHDPMFN